MRHRKAGRKLGMDASARKAMFRNMVTSLLVHGQIRTTEARAKELRRFAERVITLGRRAPSAATLERLKGDELQKAQAKRVHLVRRARLWVHDGDALKKVFGEYAERFAGRDGGYTRVVKAGRRPGDNAPMAVIQLVEQDVPTATETSEPKAEAQPAAEPTETKAEAPKTEAKATDEGAAESEEATEAEAAGEPEAQAQEAEPEEDASEDEKKSE